MENESVQLPRVLTVTVMCACAGLLAIASCTRTTDRVLEPVGGGDASTTAPEVGDASVEPIGPVARPPMHEKEEPSEDFRLARSPELGLGSERGARGEVHFAQALAIATDNGLGGVGGSGTTAGAAGRGAPVATTTGGAAFY